MTCWRSMLAGWCVCACVYGISHLYIGFYHFCFAHVCLTSNDSFDRRFYVSVYGHVCICMCFFFKLDAISDGVFPFPLYAFHSRSLFFSFLVCLVLCISLSVCQRVTYFCFFRFTVYTNLSKWFRHYKPYRIEVDVYYFSVAS